MDDRREWIVAGAPAVDTETLLALLRHDWGLAGRLQPVYAERDLNFRFTGDDGARYLLKVHHPDRSRANLALQDRTLSHLANHLPHPPVPRPVPNLDQETLVRLPDGGAVRLLTWLQGDFLDLSLASPAAARAAGEALAHLGLALRTVDAAGAPNDLPWDLQSFQSLASLLDATPGRPLASNLERTLDLHRREWLPRLATLPRQLVHNDLNPDNVLFDPEDRTAVTGVIDFGDMVVAPVVCDLAVACAYTLECGAEDPLPRMLSMTEGFHRVRPLDPAEQTLLPGLVASRLATTALIQGARVARGQDDDGELARAVDTAGVRLAALYDLGLDSVEARVRAACGGS